MADGSGPLYVVRLRLSQEERKVRRGALRARALFDLLEFVTVAPAKGALRGEGQ